MSNSTGANNRFLLALAENCATLQFQFVRKDLDRDPPVNERRAVVSKDGTSIAVAVVDMGKPEEGIIAAAREAAVGQGWAELTQPYAEEMKAKKESGPSELDQTRNTLKELGKRYEDLEKEFCRVFQDNQRLAEENAAYAKAIEDLGASDKEYREAVQRAGDPEPAQDPSEAEEEEKKDEPIADQTGETQASATVEPQPPAEKPKNKGGRPKTKK